MSTTTTPLRERANKGQILAPKYDNQTATMLLHQYEAQTSRPDGGVIEAAEDIVRGCDECVQIHCQVCRLHPIPADQWEERRCSDYVRDTAPAVKPPRAKHVIICVDCGEERNHAAYGRCNACDKRARRRAK